MKKQQLTLFKYFVLAGGIFLVLSLQGCFTGVESTGKINLSKKDLSAVAPTKEDTFLDDVIPVPLEQWEPGRKFIVADDKFNLIADGNPNVTVTMGDTLLFDRMKVVSGIGGSDKIALIFRIGNEEISYPVDKTPQEGMKSLTGVSLPMLIDLNALEDVRTKLKGQVLWTRSALWNDENLEYKKGKKFDRVIVSDVTPGNAFFPLIISFADSDGNNGKLFMNFGNAGNDSRSFSKLFSLTDPRKNYRQISDEMWEAIMNEEVRVGMTKEECRLSRGNPSDVDMGHSYSNAMETWYYPNGSYLRFVDGLLVGGK